MISWVLCSNLQSRFPSQSPVSFNLIRRSCFTRNIETKPKPLSMVFGCPLSEKRNENSLRNRPAKTNTKLCNYDYLCIFASYLCVSWRGVVKILNSPERNQTTQIYHLYEYNSMRWLVRNTCQTKPNARVMAQKAYPQKNVVNGPPLRDPKVIYCWFMKYTYIYAQMWEII